MDNQIVSLSKVEKKFGKFQALKDVTFDVKKGEVLGFIGKWFGKINDHSNSIGNVEEVWW